MADQTNGFQSVFERHEKKYMLTREQYERLLPSLKLFAEPDEYGLYTIQSLYFDTEDYTLARLSAAKPAYKEKLRLRSYGIPAGGDPVFLELKKKAADVVYKRRTTVPCAPSMSRLSRGLIPDPDSLADGGPQILREIDWFLRHWNRPRPRVFLAYDRVAYAGTEDPSLRVTFDFNVRWREDALELTAGDSGRALFLPAQQGRPEQHCLMEIKTPGALPAALSALLSRMEIYPTSYSKYGTVYATVLLPRLIKGAAGDAPRIEGGLSYAG